MVVVAQAEAVELLMQETTKGSGNTPPTSPSQGNDGGQGIGDFTFFGVGGGGGGAFSRR